MWKKYFKFTIEKTHMINNIYVFCNRFKEIKNIKNEIIKLLTKNI